MNLELHHVFILVKPGGEAAELLHDIGLYEGTRNRHEGQGTTNRRFFFSNGTLELLWVCDENEALHGPGRDMCLVERSNSKAASPFGLMFNRRDNISFKNPFSGWTYYPSYFQPPWTFYVGANSKNVNEPLCVYMPFVEPGVVLSHDDNVHMGFITEVKVHVTEQDMSEILNVVKEADRLSLHSGDEHLMEIVFNHQRQGAEKDFRPDLPLIVRW